MWLSPRHLGFRPGSRKMECMTIGPYIQSITTSVVLLLAISCLGISSCSGTSSNTSANGGPPTYGYEVVNTFTHARDSFTQGLEYRNGKLYESAGGDGTSSLRLVELETGRVLDKVDVPMPYFAEGITLLNGKIYQLTWQHGIGFIYDANTLSKTGHFRYDGEGWGLTNDGQSLILSDGTNRIRFIDPGSFQVTKTITVLDGNKPIDSLNELEYFDGQIYSNVWHRDLLAVINPQTGKVNAWIDLKGLLKSGEVRDEEAVLNGIAYDSANKRLFVTGKLWPKLFEIRIKQ
ncbi:MAG TPA: glutaminyl-peptide cyclotransferase [Pyrinomonadaceae bacterium]